MCLGRAETTIRLIWMRILSDSEDNVVLANCGSKFSVVNKYTTVKSELFGGEIERCRQRF